MQTGFCVGVAINSQSVGVQKIDELAVISLGHDA